MLIIRIIYYILTFLTVFYALYFVLTGLPAFKKSKTRIRKFSDKTKFAVIICARNESYVIGSLVKSLQEQNYDKKLYDIYVLPNNCTDNTREKALEAGAKVIDIDVPVKCKGDVLKYAFKYLKKTDYDAYLVFDADNVVHPDFMHYMNNVYQSGYPVAQGRKDAKNMSDNWVSCSYSLFYSIQNLFFNKARTNIKKSATINGTGFMVSKKFIEKINFDPKTVTEDIELSILTILNNERVIYVDDAITYDEQPTGFRDSLKQRKRWSVGIMQCCKLYNKKLLKKGFKDHDVSALDKVVFNIAPYNQVISLIPFVLLFILNVNSPDDAFILAVSYDYTGIILGYVLSVLLSVYTLLYYNRDVNRNTVGIILFIFFVLSWIPINIECLLSKKEFKWEPIKHNRNVELSSLIK